MAAPSKEQALKSKTSFYFGWFSFHVSETCVDRTPLHSFDAPFAFRSFAFP